MTQGSISDFKSMHLLYGTISTPLKVEVGTEVISQQVKCLPQKHEDLRMTPAPTPRAEHGWCTLVITEVRSKRLDRQTSRDGWPARPAELASSKFH